MNYPCHNDPDLFFGGHMEYENTYRGGPSQEMRDRASHLSARARTQCLTRCPLDQMRRCAQTALESKVTYGVWAGVQLPGGQTRKIPILNDRREILAAIADGTSDPRTLPGSAALLSRSEQLTLIPGRQGPPAPTPVYPARTAAIA